VNPRDLHTIFVDLRIGLDGDELSLQKLNVSGDVFFGPAYQCAGETVFETAVVDLYGVLDQGELDQGYLRDVECDVAFEANLSVPRIRIK